MQQQGLIHCCCCEADQPRVLTDLLCLQSLARQMLTMSISQPPCTPCPMHDQLCMPTLDSSCWLLAELPALPARYAMYNPAVAALSPEFTDISMLPVQDHWPTRHIPPIQ